MERKEKKPPIRKQLHIREDARRRYAIDPARDSLSGDVILADLNAARTLASRMNKDRDLARHPGQAVRAGDLNAAGLIDEVMHYVVCLYREERSRGPGRCLREGCRGGGRIRTPPLPEEVLSGVSAAGRLRI